MDIEVSGDLTGIVSVTSLNLPRALLLKLSIIYVISNSNGMARKRNREGMCQAENIGVLSFRHRGGGFSL